MPFGNLVSCATDGAPSMLGKKNGFIAPMKELSPSILTVHCVVHRHHLVQCFLTFLVLVPLKVW